MGGPMNVDEVERFPALAAEREWLAAAVALGDAGEHALPERVAELEDDLIERTAPGFEAFAEILAAG